MNKQNNKIRFLLENTILSMILCINEERLNGCSRYEECLKSSSTCQLKGMKFFSCVCVGVCVDNIIKSKEYDIQ